MICFEPSQTARGRPSCPCRETGLATVGPAGFQHGTRVRRETADSAGGPELQRERYAADAKLRQSVGRQRRTGGSSRPDSYVMLRVRDALRRCATVRFSRGWEVASGVADWGYKHGPAGFTCQSFSSLSSLPALVTFSPARTSSTWPLLRQAGRALSARTDAEPLLFYKGSYVGVRSQAGALESMA